VDDSWQPPWGGPGRPDRGIPQLGTLGGGNHFIELQGNLGSETLYVQMHSGSRGFGHGLATNYFHLAKAENPAIKGLSHILWTGKPKHPQADARNAVFYGDKAIDRSPCGTGTSARMAQLAAKAGVPVAEVAKMTIWGNHSATQYPDLFHATVGGKPAADVIGDAVLALRAAAAAAELGVAIDRPSLDRLAARAAHDGVGEAARPWRGVSRTSPNRPIVIWSNHPEAYRRRH